MKIKIKHHIFVTLFFFVIFRHIFTLGDKMQEIARNERDDKLTNRSFNNGLESKMNAQNKPHKKKKKE